MKIIPSCIIGLFIVISCTNQETSVDIQETNQDGTKAQLLQSHATSNIGEPFQILEIDNLEFTSGGGKEIAEHKKCDSTNTGFYGSYFLVDRDYVDEIGRPVGGTITIHSKNKMSDWKSTDIDQTIWEIHLKSDVISVWDSIKVGMTRSEIEKFGKVNKGLCVKKGDVYYSCDFNNFSVVYIFENDILKELTVTRKCETQKK